MLPRAPRQPDGDHRLQVAAQRPRLDVGVEAADHPALAQRTHPHETGRRRDADALGQRVVRHAGVDGQLVQDRPVHGVERAPNVVRCRPLLAP
jgi:hypothetical protein